MSATAIITDLLQQYGLQYDAAQVQEWVGLYDDDPKNLVLIRQEIYDSDQFAERFPGIAARLDNGYNAISPDEYVKLEDQYRTIARNTGLPPHFYDEPHEIAELIANDVAPDEFESRVVDGFLAARDAPEEVKAALRDFYGIENTAGALAAYFLDPDRALEAIEREFQSAQIKGAADTAQFQGLAKEQAEYLQSLGISQQQAGQGFGQLASSREVMGQIIGDRRADVIGTEDQIRAQFGNDAEAARRIQQQRARRLAAFAGSDNSSAVTQSGVVGLQDTSR